ncbi:CPBP family intramembrane glutamic endopeptidase [Glycomyces sp. NPDC047010]|uniref:CPBP family intramembrane glutamic endopeptidase n=1 Tax=Glycomyces sp. NPDC047010 TaxID=3155023 RepID=UPI0033ED0B5F
MKPRTKGLIAFLLLAFGLAGGGMFTAVLVFDLSLVNPVVQLATVAFTPAVAAFAVRKWVTKEGFADAGLRLRIRGNLGLYAAAWLGPLVFAAVALALAVALGLWEFDTGVFVLVPGLPVWASIGLLMLVVVVLTPAYWGEEFGWTSYLRLRLVPERPVLSTLLTGLIWAVWHYPLAFLGYVIFDNVVAGLAIWTVSFVFQEIILSWLRMRTGSVWAASLAHAGNNMVLFLLIGTAFGDDTRGVGMLLGTVPMVVVALWIVLSGRLASEQPRVDRERESALV